MPKPKTVYRLMLLFIVLIGKNYDRLANAHKGTFINDVTQVGGRGFNTFVTPHEVVSQIVILLLEGKVSENFQNCVTLFTDDP